MADTPWIKINELRALVKDPWMRGKMWTPNFQNIQFLIDELDKFDKLTSILAGHKQDEQDGHLQTRKLLAVQLGVEVDTEAYDEAVDYLLAPDPGPAWGGSTSPGDNAHDHLIK